MISSLRLRLITLTEKNEEWRMAVHCMKYGKNLLVVGTGESCGLVDLITPAALRSFTCSTPLWYQILRCFTYKSWTHKSVLYTFRSSVGDWRWLLNMSDSRSFDWRKFQLRLAISAMNVYIYDNYDYVAGRLYGGLTWIISLSNSQYPIK